jgi:hypothetical protein
MTAQELYQLAGVPWMVALGWFELIDTDLPCGRVICASIEEVDAVLAKRPTKVYRLIRRGPASMAFRPVARWDVARGPISGQLAFCRLDEGRKP